jgi:predicted TIM-barrel fold metal-dependent hydrolase
MRGEFRIVDTDAHQIEPPGIWLDYIEPALRAQAPRMQEGRLVVEGESLTSEGKYPLTSPEFAKATTRHMERFKGSFESGFEPSTRLEDMDAQGVDVQILYPTFGAHVLGREFRDLELLAACCAAYNDWCAEYCAAAPGRLRWAAMLPLQSPSLAVEEARRTQARGCVGFYARPGAVAGRNLYHPVYEPLWSAIETLGLPVCLHDSGSPRIPSYGDRMDTHTSGHIIAHPFEAMVAMMSLIWYGVVERHPDLRFIHVEADAGWLPYWLQRMQQHWDYSGNAEHPDLRLPPADYFERSFFVSARGDEVTLPSVVEQVGDANLLFNTDYPHPDGSWPDGIQSLLDQPISRASQERILAGNALRAFGLPEWNSADD